MSTSKGLILSSTLILFSLLQLAHSQGQPTFCNPANRPSLCSQLSDPVCAFPTGCMDSACSFTALNPCVACADTGVTYYYPGECSGNSSSTEEQKEEEEEENEEEIEEEEETSDIEVNEESSSTCPNLTVVVYIGGKFLEGKFCCGARPNPCPTYVNPVCGSLFQCIGSVCRQTKRNSCEACEDPNVNVYFPGTCREIFGNGDAEAILEEEEEEEVQEEEEQTQGGGDPQEEEEGQEDEEETVENPSHEEEEEVEEAEEVEEETSQPEEEGEQETPNEHTETEEIPGSSEEEYPTSSEEHPSHSEEETRELEVTERSGEEISEHEGKTEQTEHEGIVEEHYSENEEVVAAPVELQEIVNWELDWLLDIPEH